MKKNLFKYGKKSLALFLTVMMLMTCWVWVAPTEAEAAVQDVYGLPAMNAAAYTTGGIYGTELFDGNVDRWFKWQNGNDYTIVNYPSEIYVDVNETLQQAGYYWNVDWHFGDSTDYRILLGSNVWGDHNQSGSGNWGGMPATYYAMTNAFSNYAVDASVPRHAEHGAYSGVDGTDFDLRIVGYGYSGQGSDGWSGNGDVRHEKYILFRSNGKEDPQHATIYLKGTPKATGEYIYNTSGNSFGSYGYAQKWNGSAWKEHGDGTDQFESKGSDSSYWEGEWIEMQWNIYIYDKSALNSAINNAITYANNSAKYTYRSRQNLWTVINAATAVLQTRKLTQAQIDAEIPKLTTAINSLEERKFELTYENIFSLSDWYASMSAIDTSAAGISVDLSAGKLTLQNKASSGEAVTTHSGDTSAATAVNRDNYGMAVTEGHSYTIKYTTDHADTQAYVFFYSADGGCTHPGDSFGEYNFYVKNGTGEATFTAPTGSTRMEIRFDNNTPNSTANFRDIQVYDAERAEEIGYNEWSSSISRYVYSYSQVLTSGTVPTVSRDGYEFNTWYFADESPEIPLSTYYNSYNFGNSGSKVVYSDWEQLTYDVGYDNDFSFSDMVIEGSAVPNNANKGTVEYNVQNGTLTVQATQYVEGANNEVYTSYGKGLYMMDVKPNTEYIFSTDLTMQDMDTADDVGVKGQMFVFSYDASGNAVDGMTYKGSVTTNSHIGEYLTGDGTHSMVFTTPADCYKLAIRVGSTNYGTKATYSKIAVVEKAAYDAYVNDYVRLREPFKVGDTKSLYKPSRDGYEFDGWQTADGRTITSVEGLTESEIVYAQWTKVWTVTFVNEDGSLIGTSTVKNGHDITNFPTAPSKATDINGSYTFSKWIGNTQNITSNTTLTAEFTRNNHTVKYEIAVYPTCEEDALVNKVCATCGYPLASNVPYDGPNDETAEQYKKTGHQYVLGTIKDNLGLNVGHSIECDNGCGTTTTAAHDWGQPYRTEASTCKVNGRAYYTCLCLATKVETLPLDSSKHTNIISEGDTEATCTEGGYKGGTYCGDCNTPISEGADTPALGHAWTDTTKFNKSEADCTNDAVYYKECSRCNISSENETGATWTDAGSATGHNWTDTETYIKSEADCENNEVYYKECSNCNISSENETDATWEKAETKWNHDFSGDYVSNNDGTHVQKCVNGTCDATGNQKDCTQWTAWTTDNETTHSHSCADCGYTPTAEAHDWSDWTSTNTAGAGAGKQSRKCSVCGRVETTDCNYTSVSADPTCTMNGYTTYTCDDCGHGYTVIDADSATGHNFTGEYKFNATTDKHSRLCVNGCGSNYGIGTGKDAELGKEVACEWTYTNTGSGTHTASCVCGNTQDEECSGGQATCTSVAICAGCKTAYGTTSDHSFKGAAVMLEGDYHAFLCEYCGADTGIKGVGTVENDKEACSGGKATCTTPATCDACGDLHGSVDAAKHKWGDATNIEGTQTHVYTCKYDQTHTKEEPCFATMPAVATADCETAGYTVNTCDDCGNVWHTSPVDALGHDWGEWVSDGKGGHTRACVREGCVYNDAQDGTAKTESGTCTKANAAADVTAPTCLEKGYTTYTCNDCGYEWVDDEVNATGHSYVNKKMVKSDAYKRTSKDCTTDLTYWYRCDNCTVSAETEKDDYEDENLLYWVSEAATGHKFDKKSNTYLKSAATCTTKAVYYYACSICNVASADKTYESGAVLGHNWENTEKYKKSDADCVKDAVYYKECTREGCGVSSETVTNATWTKENSKQGHNFENGYTAYVAATCTTAGVYEHYTCATCGKKYKDADATTVISRTEIPMLSHSWKSVAYKAPTCDEDGHTQHMQCERCSIKNADYKVYAATGHDFTSGNYYVDAVNGYHAQYCKNSGCSEYGVGDTLYSTTYNEDDELVVVGGTKCTYDSGLITTTDEDGVHYHQVSCVCGNYTGDIYEDENPVVVAPTCTDKGYTLNTCPECEDTWKTDYVDALNHDLTDATSNGNGTHSQKCAREGCTYKAIAEKCSGGAANCKDYAKCDVCGGEYGEKTNHTLADDAWVSDENAECLKDGTESQNCSVCGEKQTRTEADSALGHSVTDYVYDISAWKYAPEGFDKDSIKAPTCKDEGRAISYCERCDYYRTKTVKTDTTAHVWEEEWTTLGGNCASGVTLAKSCTVCGKKQTKVESTPHDFVAVVSVKASCEEAAYIVYECKVCKTSDIVYGDPATGHSWENAEQELVVDKAPTCGIDGRGHYVCAVCKANSDYVAIDKLVHAWDLDNDGITDATFEPTLDENGKVNNDAYFYVEPELPTCTYDGHLGYYKCKICSYDQHLDENWKMNSGDFIPRLLHEDMDNDSKCDNCGVKLTTVAPEVPDEPEENTCDCICHKESGFMGLIYKFLRFFWKIFGSNQSCDCGTVHY